MSKQIIYLSILGLVAAGGAAGLVFAFSGGKQDAPEPTPDVANVEMVPVDQPADVPERKGGDAVSVAPPKPPRLAIPRDGGVWPWPVSKSHADAPTIDVPLTAIVKTKDGRSRVNVKSAAVNPSIGKAVVTMSGLDGKRPEGKKAWGEICLCDLTTGQITHQWETAKVLAPLDIHRDGRRFLMRLGTAGYDVDTQIVELWDVGANNNVRRRTWKPYYAGSKGVGIFSNGPSNIHIPEAQVKWAGFVGSHHIATVNGNVLKLWGADDLDLVATIPNVVGLPAVSPDGGKLAYLTGDAVALLDPIEPAVIAAKRLGTLPPNPVLTFHPGAQRLAVVGTGRAIVLELASKDGQVWDAMLAELKNDPKGNWVELPPSCGWAGDRHIFFNGDLYDLNMPVPVWHYSWSDWANVQGRCVWAVADHPRDNATVLKKFTIPHEGMTQALKVMMLNGDLFDLRPGDRVSVDVSGLPASRQEEIRSTLERRLANLGYEIGSSTSVVFQASVDAPKPAKVTYKDKEYAYTSQPARLKVYRNGKEIWNAIGVHSPPMLVWYNTSTGLADAVRSYGGADYSIFTDKPLPGVIRRSGKSGALGSSSFRAYGIEEK